MKPILPMVVKTGKVAAKQVAPRRNWLGGPHRSTLPRAPRNPQPTARLDPEISRSRPDPDVEPNRPRSEAAGHDAYAALRLGDYRRFLLGMMVCTSGNQMLGVAVGWELYRRTGSAWVLGLVGLVQFVPVLLLALPAGHVVDRHSRKWLLLAAQGIMALASLGLAALSAARGPVPLVYGCLLLTGIAKAVSKPAEWSLLPQLVPVKLLAGTVTLKNGGMQVAWLAGPAWGGW